MTAKLDLISGKCLGMSKYDQHQDDPMQHVKYEEKDYLNEGEEDQMEVEGYKKCTWYNIVSWFLVIVSLGLFQLLFFWFPKVHLFMTHKRSPLGVADKVLIADQYEKYKTFFIKNVVDGIIIEQIRKERNYSYVNEGFDGKKKVSGSGVHSFPSLSVKVHFHNGYSKDVTKYRMIQVKKLRYIWVEEKGKFLKLTGIGPGMKQAELHSYPDQSAELQNNMRKLYGRNEILVQVQSYLALFLVEISSPYYFFQFFSILVWILDNYYYYTYAVLIVTALGIAVTVIQTHRVQHTLQKTVQASDAVRAEIVLPGGEIQETPCSNLVPGDRIAIPDNEEYTVPCDAVILSGSCIVRESMLTGESVPLTKTVLPPLDEDYNEKESANHMLYSGTKVIQTRRDGSSPVTALVLRTGYVTAKGDLVRAILYPPPVDYEFEQSIYAFINISAIGAFLLSIGVSVWLAFRKMPKLVVFAKSFELLTMVIPAAIPGALALCKAYSIQRFRRRNIACINSKVINVAGSSNCVCFDKTGTITEDGLDIWGVVPAVDGAFHAPNNKPSSLNNNYLKFSLASCHSLSIIGGKILGDPLDAKMLESTGWIFEESKNDSTSGTHTAPVVYPSESQLRISLLHQNQFVSNLQRMSVITKQNQSNLFDLYCKGSPEMVASLSKTKTVPNNLDEILQIYTKKGYRVLALGWRQLEDQPLDILKKKSRSELELDLEFLGLLIMENKVKSASKPTIQLLKRGEIKITMITGDNIQTAISVSRECDIISPDEELVEIEEINEKLVFKVNSVRQSAFSKKDISRIEEGLTNRPYKLAMTGKAWELVRKQPEDFVAKILVRTAVFARMASKQKQQVVSELQAIGYCVVMCGDGANDCAALKASNVGVSLSEAEASVASPLSSAQQDISCIPTVIREGRSSLTASLGLIKFILCYGYIQLTSCIISYAFGSNLSSFEFIWEDIVLVILFSISYALTNAHEGDLVPRTPVKKMLNLIPLSSMILHMIVCIAFQFLSYFWIQTFPWYEPGPVEPHLKQPTDLMISYSYRNYALFSVSSFQIIIAAVVFSQGYPYRKPIYTNYIYLISLAIATILSGFLVISPGVWVQELFTLALPPMKFRYLVLVMAAVNFIICYLVEQFIVQHYLCKKYIKWRENNKNNKYVMAFKESTEKTWLYRIVDL